MREDAAVSVRPPLLPATIVMLHKPSGVERTLREDSVWRDDDDGTSEFWWSEGNMSCDCNRGPIFHREDPDWVDDTCAVDDQGVGYCFNGSDYAVLSITLDDGRVVYSEAP